MKHKHICLTISALLLPVAVMAQESSYSRWETRSNRIQANQPAVPVPVVSADAGLVQLFRTDVVRQILPGARNQWILGNGKGVDILPLKNTEVDFNSPPYLKHGAPGFNDGFGDFSMLYKYRFRSGDANHGNFSLSASLGASVPTGSYNNGNARATLTPTFYAGKGIGKAYFQTNLSGTLPTSNAQAVGRTIAWNAVLQDHEKKVFWPELEMNATFYHGGPNDGKSQVFLTPGVMVSKFHLQHRDGSRLAILFGGGFQMATSRYHAYNHAVVLTTRIAF